MKIIIGVLIITAMFLECKCERQYNSEPKRVNIEHTTVLPLTLSDIDSVKKLKTITLSLGDRVQIPNTKMSVFLSASNWIPKSFLFESNNYRFIPDEHIKRMERFIKIKGLEIVGTFRCIDERIVNDDFNTFANAYFNSRKNEQGSVLIADFSKLNIFQIGNIHFAYFAYKFDPKIDVQYDLGDYPYIELQYLISFDNKTAYIVSFCCKERYFKIMENEFHQIAVSAKNLGNENL